MASDDLSYGGHDVAHGHRTAIAAVAGLVLVTVVGLAWAKWWPYSLKVESLVTERMWPGQASVVPGAAHAAPSLEAAWTFTLGYGRAVWRALAVALVIAIAFEGLPRAWLVRATRRRSGLGQAAVGGAVSLPGMMCTCCSAPIVVALRRGGASPAASVAYWLGNPLLNPAVLVFLALVLPWQYAAVRLVVGLGVVLGAGALLGARGRAGAHGSPVAAASTGAQGLPRRYLKRALQLALVLVPEYVVSIFLVGLLSPWFADLPLGGGIVTVVVLAVVGVLVVIPTGGEIPIIAALLAGGVGAGAVGALLIVLPALSLPSMIMVGRALTWRVTALVAGLATVGGLVAAAAAVAIT